MPQTFQDKGLNMKKKKIPFGKFFLLILVVAIVGGGYWLSIPRSVSQAPVEKPVELKLNPAQ